MVGSNIFPCGFQKQWQACWLDVTCTIGETGEKIGMVSVEAAYDAQYTTWKRKP